MNQTGGDDFVEVTSISAIQVTDAVYSNKRIYLLSESNSAIYNVDVETGDIVSVPLTKPEFRSQRIAANNEFLVYESDGQNEFSALWVNYLLIYDLDLNLLDSAVLLGADNQIRSVTDMMFSGDDLLISYNSTLAGENRLVVYDVATSRIIENVSIDHTVAKFVESDDKIYGFTELAMGYSFNSESYEMTEDVPLWPALSNSRLQSISEIDENSVAMFTPVAQPAPTTFTLVQYEYGEEDPFRLTNDLRMVGGPPVLFEPKSGYIYANSNTEGVLTARNREGEVKKEINYPCCWIVRLFSD